MVEATSCGGVVIYRGKVLLLYKNYKNRYEGWVLPKGRIEQGETLEDTALREVREETGAKCKIVGYIGAKRYSFYACGDLVEKEVHWYLMRAGNYHNKPLQDEFFYDSGFYKYHEAYHLLKFGNERQILEQAYQEYLELKRSNLWESGV